MTDLTKLPPIAVLTIACAWCGVWIGILAIAEYRRLKALRRKERWNG